VNSPTFLPSGLNRVYSSLRCLTNAFLSVINATSQQSCKPTFLSEVIGEDCEDIIVMLVGMRVSKINVRSKCALRQKDIDVQIPETSYRLILVKYLWGRVGVNIEGTIPSERT
jgi:hypothetical protein